MVGLKADGTVVIAGDGREYQQSDVSGWHDIVAISVDVYLLGLKADGTIVSAGELPPELRPILKWTDIIAIDAYIKYFVVGLKADGSVKYCSTEDRGLPYHNWHEIVAITAHFSGVKSDGTVISSVDVDPMPDALNE